MLQISIKFTQCKLTITIFYYNLEMGYVFQLLKEPICPIFKFHSLIIHLTIRYLRIVNLL